MYDKCAFICTSHDHVFRRNKLTNLHVHTHYKISDKVYEISYIEYKISNILYQISKNISDI